MALVFAVCIHLSGIASAAEPLRVCAEPDNLPTSHRGGPLKGLYLDLIEELGNRIGRPVEYVWIEGTGDRPIRFAFTTDQCDAYVGVPATKAFRAPYMALTRPFMRSGYVLVVPKGQEIRSLNDLAGRRVAVQFGTLPQILLALNDIEMRTCDTPEEAMNVLGRHQADAAFIWGPVAGYFNKYIFHDAYSIIPANGEGLEWPIAIGVRKDDAKLRESLDQELVKIKPLVVQLQNKYGYPTGVPIKVDTKEPTTPGRRSSRTSIEDWYVKNQPITPSATIADGFDTNWGFRKISYLEQPITAHWLIALNDNPTSDQGMSPDAQEGRHLFNSRCAHCHGDDAITGNEERSIPDLLRRIPPDQMESFFISVVTNGEADQGMPPWKGALSEEQMKKIFAFIRWVQEHRHRE